MIDGPQQPIPIWAILVSVLALAVPVGVVFVLPSWAAEDASTLLWMTLLVPAFLLGFYRGLRGVAVALAAGLAILSLTQVVVAQAGLRSPDWGQLFAVVLIVVSIAGALAVFAEGLISQRRAAEELALFDPLTGIPNRRYAERVLGAEVAAAMRGRRVVVVLFDLDRFKQVNDRYGHDAGDEALRGFAEVLTYFTRRMNLCARYGGEEFISILSDSDADGALIFANRVRDRMKQKEFPWGSVTVSGGAAAFQEGMGSHDVLVAAADRALYAAKAAGRDRIEAAREFGAGKRVSVAAGLRAIPETPEPVAGGKVLVVGEDSSHRSAVVRALRHVGYETVDTDDPVDAVRRHRDAGNTFDLLVTDVMMSKMNGLTLAETLAALQTDLRVVYVAEHLEGRPSWTGLPGAAVGFLQKPIDPEVLLPTVRDVLEQEALELGSDPA